MRNLKSSSLRMLEKPVQSQQCPATWIALNCFHEASGRRCDQGRSDHLRSTQGTAGTTMAKSIQVAVLKQSCLPRLQQLTSAMNRMQGKYIMALNCRIKLSFLRGLDSFYDLILHLLIPTATARHHSQLLVHHLRAVWGSQAQHPAKPYFTHPKDQASQRILQLHSSDPPEAQHITTRPPKVLFDGPEHL